MCLCCLHLPDIQDGATWLDMDWHLEILYVIYTVHDSLRIVYRAAHVLELMQQHSPRTRLINAVSGTIFFKPRVNPWKRRCFDRSSRPSPPVRTDCRHRHGAHLPKLQKRFRVYKSLNIWTSVGQKLSTQWLTYWNMCSSHSFLPRLQLC